MSGLIKQQKEDLHRGRGKITGLDAQASVKEGGRYWIGIISRLLLLFGVLSSLLYFYFSAEHKGIVGGISRFGVWVLMIGFGASFGFTVQGRLSLAIGRALDILGKDKDPVLAAQIHGGTISLLCIVIIVSLLFFVERRAKQKSEVL